MCIIDMEIKPKDTFLFRDTMSMKKGTTNFIESMAMPYPSVLYGMLTTALMREGYLADLKAKLRHTDRGQRSGQRAQTAGEAQRWREQFLEQNLQLKCMFLEYDEEFYIPAPLDLFVDGQNRTYQGNYKDGLLYAPKCTGKKLEHVDGMFIRFSEFLYRYMKNDIKGISLREESHFWGHYSKAGIEIDNNTRSAKEDMLYFARMGEAREKTAYYVQAELKKEKFAMDDWKANVLLGGRNRTAYLKQLSTGDFRLKMLEKYKTITSESRLLKMIFTTPFILKDADDLDQIFEHNGIHVETRVTGKPLVLGGFDMASGKRKELQTALPAGSIYLLSSDKFLGKPFGKIESRLESLLQNSKNQYFRGFGRFVLSKAEG